MKSYVIILSILLMFGCSSDDSKPTTNTSLIGKWKLIEQYFDPGDGSGDFQTVESQRIIEFFNDETVKINGDFCFMSSEIGDVETGVFTVTSDEASDTTFDGEITPDTCGSGNVKVFFNLQANGSLVLWFSCIEGCAQKFKKI